MMLGKLLNFYKLKFPNLKMRIGTYFIIHLDIFIEISYTKFGAVTTTL